MSRSPRSILSMLLPLALAAAAAARADLPDLTRHVDPFIGTDDSDSPHPVPGGAGGSTFPGATMPFGMVQFSPDTPTASPSGYRHGDAVIESFSLTHFNGAGCPNNEDLPCLPVVGPLDASPGAARGSYATPCAKDTELAAPGYYAVRLEPDGIDVELTATTRTGFARFTYPATREARLLLHAGRSATGDREGTIEITGPDRLQGTLQAGGFCGSNTGFPIHFVVRFDRPCTGYGTWRGDEMVAGRAAVTGTPAGAYLTFDTTADPVVQMKVGLSYVSVANAAANLQAENPDWDFTAMRTAADRRWNEVLNRIQVSGAGDDDLTRFYTALYHVFQNPNIAGDVNGEYLGFDGRVHHADRPVYQNYSGWDIIRSWTHLMAAVAPETPDIIASLVQDGVEGGLLPFWSHQSVETRVMVGDPGTVNVANAHAMGVRGFDERAALALMIKSADDPDDTQRWGLADWLNLHFVGDASISLEYAMADFALAEYARALGDEAAAARYRERAGWWRESWHAADGYIEPRAGGASLGGDAARIYEVEVYGPADPDANLALSGTAAASGACNRNEGPEKAINGSWQGGTADKWCDHGEAMWWQLDLGAERRLSRVVVRHAGAGGEPADWNTQDFDLAVSRDGATFTTVAEVRGNTADVSTHPFAVVAARYVRLNVITEIQRGVAEGDWQCQPFDPASQCGFVEGNGAQYLWMVPHDLAGLIDLLGGPAAANARLDHLFAELNAGTNRPHFYIGNEPEHGTPWTYNFTGEPWKTQAVVRRLVAEEFGTGPGGLPGNDDLGATSAWLVWAYLGMYPVIPGTDVLVLSGPLVPQATVHLANGRTLTVTSEGAAPRTAYVQKVTVDGRPLARNWLRFREISGGATVTSVMGAAPDRRWGASLADRPPSFAPAAR